MDDAFDVIVIGGGVAGVAAALTARAAGAAVALVRAAPGATAISSGGWRGPLPALIGDALAGAGLPFVPVKQPLPHPLGDLRRYDFAAESHARAFDRPGGALCGVAGLSGFSSPALARLYGSAEHPPGAHFTITVEGTPRDGWAPHALASAISRNPSVLADAVRQALPAGATHVVFPAVLGMDDGARVRAALEAVLGIPVCEALGAPPSIPGWRLDRALINAARAAAVVLVNGRAAAAGTRADSLTSVTVTGGGAARTMSAAHFILATGKFIGGGIVTGEKRLVESAMALPVWVDHLGQRFTTADSLTLTSRVRTYDQPLLKAGVHVNDARQPIDTRDRVVFANVTVAGSVVAGVDCATLGLGEAAAQGIAAAQRIVRGVDT